LNNGIAVFAPDRRLRLVKSRRQPNALVEVMSTPKSAHSADTIADTLRHVHGVTVNPAQCRRLNWLASRQGAPFVWAGRQPLPDKCRFVVAVEPPGRLQLERVDRAIASDAVLAIPCGEDPAYDELKTRFTCFGTVGADGADGPHQFWWGGNTPRHVLRAGDVAATAAPPPDIGSCLEAPLAERLLSLWQASSQPVVWTDHARDEGARVAKPSAFDCDFAVRRLDDGRLSAAALYFGRRPAAAALLLTWEKFSRIFRKVDDMQLLDQAWRLVTSQTPLDTLWLPEFHDDVARKSAPSCIREWTVAMAEWPQSTHPAARTGPPELSMRGAAATGRSALAIVRDSQSRGSRALASTVESLAHAFATDSADYCQLEVALCATRHELQAAFAAASVDSVLVVTPAHAITDDIFRKLADESRLCAVVSPPLQPYKFPRTRARCPA
jgi:hypothetical protein